jgi:hypothetical protein
MKVVTLLLIMTATSACATKGSLRTERSLVIDMKKSKTPKKLRAFFIFPETVTTMSANMSNPWTTPGDFDVLSGPLYSFPEENARQVGNIYGVCTITRPLVSDYCDVTVYYDDGVIKGGWTHMGTIFNPAPSPDPFFGDFTIVGTRGDFAIYTGGVVTSSILPVTRSFDLNVTFI